MPYNYSRSGSSRFICHKSKLGMGDFPPCYGRNAPHLSEKECRRLHGSKRKSRESEKASLRRKGCFRINIKVATGSSKKVAFATNVNDFKRKPPGLTERKENQLSLGLNKINSGLFHSGDNHRLIDYGFDDEFYRKEVKKALFTFRKHCDQLSKDKQKHDGEIKVGRIDRAAAMLLKEKNMYVHAGVKFIGRVPGVEIGHTFIYRIELAVVGVHCPLRAGIDYTRENGGLLALSVVASKHYTDELKSPDELVYVGEGGMPSSKKQPEDQKLVRGNLALANNYRTRNPVRVILKVGEFKSKIFNYVYDGLYKVHGYERVCAKSGQMVYHFKLKRSSDQRYLLPCKIKF